MTSGLVHGAKTVVLSCTSSIDGGYICPRNGMQHLDRSSQCAWRRYNRSPSTLTKGETFTAVCISRGSLGMRLK